MPLPVEIGSQNPASSFDELIAEVVRYFFKSWTNMIEIIM